MDDFEFQIGDTLTHRALLEPPVPAAVPRFFVLERIQQECPGGIQRHYTCRLVCALQQQDGSFFQDQKLTILETELTSYSEFVAARQKFRDDEIAFREKMLELEEKLIGLSEKAQAWHKSVEDTQK